MVRLNFSKKNSLVASCQLPVAQSRATSHELQVKQRSRLNKRGWIRMLETVIAIMVLGSIILVVLNRQVPNVSSSDYISNIQKGILKDVSSNSTLYNYALSGDESALKDFVFASVSNVVLNHSVRVCDLKSPMTDCEIESPISDLLLDKNVYVEEIIISANLTTYSPKKVRLFTWVE